MTAQTEQCFYCQSETHTLGYCDDNRLYIFEVACATTIQETPNLIQFKHWLEETYSEEERLLRAFAIIKGLATPETPLADCVDLIVDFCDITYLNDYRSNMRENRITNMINTISRRNPSMEIQDVDGIESIVVEEFMRFVTVSLLARDNPLILSSGIEGRVTGHYINTPQHTRANIKVTVKTVKTVEEHEEPTKTGGGTSVSDSTSASDSISVSDSTSVTKSIEPAVYCCICMEEHAESTFVKLNCDHEYCKSCLMESLKKKTNCPLCRENILTIETKQQEICDEITNSLTSTNNSSTIIDSDSDSNSGLVGF
jgi:hypothetical protein